MFSVIAPSPRFTMQAAFRRPLAQLRQKAFVARTQTPAKHYATAHRLSVTKHPLDRNTLPFALKFGTIAGVAGIGLGLSSWIRPPVVFETSVPHDASLRTNNPLPPPPVSSVSLYELSFGSLCGVCAGVFIKKGAKAVAFLLGGVFVMLQYFGSLSLVRVNWSAVGSKFENLFYTKEASGARQPPTVVSVWNWLVSFLTADFQPRASFLAGLMLGLRIG